MRRNLQRLMVVMAAMMICLGASAIDKVVKKVTLTGEVTSVADLQAAEKFLLQDAGTGLMFVALDGVGNYWDFNVATPATMIGNDGKHAGYFKLDKLADQEHFRIEMYNINGSRRGYWGGDAYVNAQPTGNVIFGLDGQAPKYGQDGQDLALWDIEFDAEKGFAFKCVGRAIYIGSDGAENARPSDTPVYWKAYTGYEAGFVAADVEAAVKAVDAALKTTDAKAAFADAKTAYETDQNVDAYAAAINAAIDAINECEKINAQVAAYKLSTLGAAAVKDVLAKYNAGEYKDAAALGAAYVEAVKAQNCDGADMTGAIINPSFELGNTSGWTVTDSDDTGAKENSNATYTMTNCDGKYVFNIWSSGNAISQKIEGMPNGTYKLQAVIATDGGHKVQLNGNDKNVQIDAVDKGTGVEGELEFDVTDGTITIGAEGVDKYWYKVDNFRLTLVKAETPYVPEKDDWFTGADGFRFRALKGAGTDSPYAAFSDKVEPGWGADPADPTNGCIVAVVAPGTSTTSQLWIKGGEGFSEGQGFNVTMRVKADAEYKEVTTTAHKNWGWFTNAGFGNLDVTTEWKTVSILCVATSDTKDFTDLCLNLSGDAERTFYFDDIQIEPAKDPWYYTVNFAAKDYANPDAVYDDAEPNPAAPWDAEVGAIKIVSNAKVSNSYESQFFMQIADVAPEGKFNKNDQVIVKFRAKAETANADLKEIQAGAGYHRNYNGNGWISNNSENNVTITVGEWTDIEKTLTITNPDVTNYSLDLTYDAAPITYYFDDFSFEYVAGTDDWYLNNKIYAKDFPKGDETYENGTVFPAAPFVNGAVQVKSNASAANDYDSQIFFEIPESLRGGEVELTMKVKASKEISVATALHSSADGNGWSGNPAGDAVTFPVSEFTEITRVFNTDCQDSNGNPIAYYVLNLSEKDGEAVTYYFDDLSIKKYFAPVEWGDLVEVPVEGTLVTEKDWTKETSYSYWSADMPEGCTRTIENGIVIENTKTDGDPWANQMFTLDGLTLAEGKEYVLRYTLKINGEGDLRADVGPWGTNLVKAPDTQTLENGYRQVVFGIGPCAQEYTGAHAIWQSRKFVGKIIIEKVELFDITPDYAAKDWSDNILKNGDLKGDDMSEFVLKNNDVEDPEMLLAEKNEYGEIGIETAARPTNEDGSVGGNDYDAQFFVRLPYVLPKGSLFNLEFDVYAEEVNTLAIQAHGEPGQYKANLGSVKTDTSGEGIVHYQKYLSAPEDMRSIAFNLAVETKATYGFSNFKVQIVKDDQAAIDAATADADATTLWPETLALNEACYAGRVVDTEGCTEESVKALTDAVAAGKAELKNEAPTAESLAAATKAIVDAIVGLEKPKPELAYTDLTADMFFQWSDWTDAEATAQAYCEYKVGESSGQPYGDPSVNNYADLSGYTTLEVTVTEGAPRFLFNRDVAEGQWSDNEADSHLIDNTKSGWSDKYFSSTDNGDGTTTYVVDIAQLVADKGYAHLMAIKGANWANTTVTEMKLGYVGEKPALPVPTNIFEVADDAAVKDGKYFINGQIVIVKNGVKYNAAGVAIE